MKRLAAPTVVLTILASAATVGAQEWEWPKLPPTAPSAAEAIATRLSVLCPQLLAQRAKIKEVKDQNDWFDRLILDRIAGVYSRGEGLSAVDQETATNTTTILTQQDNEAWAVTYSLPLSVFRSKHSIDAHAGRDLEVLRATQKLAVLKEIEALRSLILDLSASRFLFEKTCTANDDEKPACIAPFFASWKAHSTLTSRLDVSGVGECQLPDDLQRMVTANVL